MWCEWPTERCHQLAWTMQPVPLCQQHAEQLNRETLPVYNAMKRLAVAETLDGRDVKKS